LVERVAVSDLCDEYQLQPTTFYLWQKQFFENGAAAFVCNDRPQKRAEEVKIQQPEAKLTRKWVFQSSRPRIPFEVGHLFQ